MKLFGAHRGSDAVLNLIKIFRTLMICNRNNDTGVMYSERYAGLL